MKTAIGGFLWGVGFTVALVVTLWALNSIGAHHFSLVH